MVGLARPRLDDLRISYEEIRDHGLIKSASESDQEIGLQWLHERLDGI